ncbi:flagellar hook-associated protein FlgL [Arthrobacter sp. zg-Y877]|uniref:flagellar hook-associated protein FlgL n=1 Tax=Arthrobacter sp. zg-Y877 TaxID=3049074 RepID=UPI0025A3B396|nr:flagellar hook-associated protein FlgL [Arthrobacter sp. zg-Y877]MDM7991674.1 flagellar hook-associated protein FlgL [Arthrobacter sp. zg-Y877]
MITRTTNQTMARTAQLNLQSSMSRMAKLQEQVASSAAITRPSDDPTGTANALKVRSEIRANEQYTSNVSDADGWLTLADDALTNTTDILRRVKDLTLNAATGTMSANDRKAVATELAGLKTDLLREANTTYLGRTIFAGTSDTGKAFTEDPAGSYNFSGSSTPTTRRVDSNTLVRVDTDGEAVFGAGDNSVFRLVDNLVADLNANNDVSGYLGKIDAAANTVLMEHSSLGVRHAATINAKETLADRSVSLETRRSGIEDLDTAKVILDMKLQEVAYQSALAITAKALQPTLMDFLR